MSVRLLPATRPPRKAPMMTIGRITSVERIEFGAVEPSPCEAEVVDVLASGVAGPPAALELALDCAVVVTTEVR